MASFSIAVDLDEVEDMLLGYLARKNHSPWSASTFKLIIVAWEGLLVFLRRTFRLTIHHNPFDARAIHFENGDVKFIERNSFVFFRDVAQFG